MAYGFNVGTLVNLTPNIKVDCSYSLMKFGFQKEYRGTSDSKFSQNFNVGLKISF